MNTKLSVFLLTAIVIPALSFAQFRKYSNEFLNIGAGARGLAMGNAQVASVEDATSGYWNPAGLATFRSSQVTFQQAPMPLQTSYQYLGYAQPLYAMPLKMSRKPPDNKQTQSKMRR